MKKIFFTLLCIATVLTVWVGCKKDKEMPVFFVDLDLQVTPFPANGATNQSCLTKIYLSFNNTIDIHYTNTVPYFIYRIVIDSTWMCPSNNQLVPAIIELNSNKDSLTYTPTGNLVANTGYQINLTYHIEVKEKSTDVYEVMLKDGQPFQGTFESTFSTREYNYSIDSSNVEYSYPVINQYHFLRKETTRGVLKLKPNQENDLYYKNETYKVRISSLTGQSWESDATYNADERKYIFQIPSNNLENQKIYRIEYIMVNATSKSETVFLTYHFRTSKFDTFEEKISSASNFYDAYYFEGQGIAKLYKFFDMQEPFDRAEGKEYQGLVRFEALADATNPWMVNFFKFYDGLKLHASRYKIDWSRDQNVEVPPLNAIYLSKDKLTPLLTHQQISENVALNQTDEGQLIIHYISFYFIRDFGDIRSQIFYYGNDIDAWETFFINWLSYGMAYGYNYYFKIKYVAGDQITYTSGVWSVYY